MENIIFPAWEELLQAWCIERFDLNKNVLTVVNISNDEANKLLKALAIPMWQCESIQYKLVKRDNPRRT